jgi:PAS domain S-box-containing protein
MTKEAFLTGNERTFSATEIIVSKTDLKGRIVYANDLFFSIADYEEKDVVGQPHSLIRHPNMPRCIFSLMWSSITKGEELFAYVVNRTNFGDHYWVLAHVTPTVDERGTIIGFHSSRRAPARQAVREIERLYAELKAIEDSHSNAKEGLRASQAMLNQHLAKAGQRYDQFMFALMNRSAAV